jgi:membrane associated rhomboid family serine protease
MEEKEKFKRSLIFPIFFLFVIWFIKFSEFGLDSDFSFLGIYPLKLRGIFGVFTAPLVHADIKHLADNSVAVFVLSAAVFYFYREVAFQVFFLVYFITGMLVWIVGREAYHIGASGLIYGFASFLFVSGIIRRNRNLMAISLLVIFLYGSLVWGLIPYDYRVSWESHLMGALTGLLLAVIYRDEGPVADVSRILDDEDEEVDDRDFQIPENEIDEERGKEEGEMGKKE